MSFVTEVWGDSALAEPCAASGATARPAAATTAHHRAGSVIYTSEEVPTAALHQLGTPCTESAGRGRGRRPCVPGRGHLSLLRVGCTGVKRSHERFGTVTGCEEDGMHVPSDVGLDDVDLIGEPLEQKRVAQPQSLPSLNGDGQSDPSDIGGALGDAACHGKGGPSSVA